MQPRLSLKARAIQLLSQREHSRLELRRKLLRHAVAACKPEPVDPLAPAQARRSVRRTASESSPSPGDSDRLEAIDAVDALGEVSEADAPEHGDDVDPGPCLDKLLDWLEAHRYLSQERFVESRVHARQGRFGTRRIAQELAQHGVTPDAAVMSSLRKTEVERAKDVWRRKFAEPARTPAEHAKQTRFLLLRGFSSDAVRAAVGRMRTVVGDDGD